MSSRNFHILVDGSVAHSLNTSTVSILLESILSDPSQASESDLRGEWEVKARQGNYPLRKIKVADLMWQIGEVTFDHSLIEDADVTDPIFVQELTSSGKGAYKVIEGMEILHKAFSMGKKNLIGFIVPASVQV